jgi:hypothetical protein
LRADPTLSHEGFNTWFAALRELAAERDLTWLVATAGESHHAAFAAQISPAEYLETYAAMAEWRGCGCGGG